MSKSRLRGVRKVRKFLKTRPDAIKGAIVREIRVGAEDVLLDMRGLAPKRSGDMAAALSVKYAKDGLSAVVGYPVKKDFVDHFYWLYQEYGTKGDPDRNIPPQQATPFVDPAFKINAPIIAEQISKATLGALKAGVGLIGKRK